jgi:hypothetical protein
MEKICETMVIGCIKMTRRGRKLSLSLGKNEPCLSPLQWMAFPYLEDKLTVELWKIDSATLPNFLWACVLVKDKKCMLKIANARGEAYGENSTADLP